MATPAYLATLNTAQRKAATFGQIRGDAGVTSISAADKTAAKGVAAGPLLIIAGAGTGKTTPSRTGWRTWRCTASIRRAFSC